MDLNHETAMRLWTKQFGKSNEVLDYAGRKMMKGAYNQRNSQFGWNVDHILPESKGGKTTDANLICCHILTNDEKADKFPAFVANGKRFNAVRVENHYEIHPVEESHDENSAGPKEEAEELINLFDSASGIRLFKKLKGIQNKHRFVGSVFVELEDVKNTALIDFVELIFDTEDISFITKDYVTIITIKNYDMPLKSDLEELLNKCILLNTYLHHYFLPMDYIGSYQIAYDMDYYEKKENMYNSPRSVDKDAYYGDLPNSLYINELVYQNMEEKDKIPNPTFDQNYEMEYDYYYTKLAENLDKEVNRD